MRGRFTRMGVINLYEYANEVFVFEDGKLVIKGANGVGKSRALELTFPLLLEGNIAEYRVDTSGKQGRPFAWNLSLGDVYTRRVGYVWLETLMPVGEDGETEYVTVGMGASGGQSGGSQTTDSTWFFLLRGARILDPARGVGEVDLAPDGQPLSRRALGGALGPSGRTFTAAMDYRRAVNDALFGFASMDAYQSMVNLLFLLRRPKLAEVLTPEVFDEQLTNSLPELDLTLVKEGADRLDMLERMRERIDGLQADRDAAVAFGEVYERYVLRLGHERATRLLDTERIRESAEQAAAGLRADREQLERDQVRHTEQLVDADARRERLEGQREALLRKLNSPGAQRLNEATAAAQAAEKTYSALNRRVLELREDLDERRAELQRLSADADGAEAQLRAAQAGIDTRAGECGVPPRPWPAALDALTAHVETIERERRHREQLLSRAAQLDAELDRVVDVLERAERHAERLVGALEGKQADALTAAESATAAREEVEDQVRWWAGDLAELSLTADVVEDILAGLDGESALLDLAPIAVAHDAHRERVGADRAAAEHALARIDGELGAAREELARLARGVNGRPDLAAWRDDADGPALWELVDFKDGLTAAQRDGLEAALDASGLLTAVPAADGVRTADGQLLLVAAEPVSGKSLADVLAIDPDALGAALERTDTPTVDIDALRAALASVAIAPKDAGAAAAKRGPVVLGLDGSCAVGPLRAQRDVRPAAWVGATARERGRLARQEQLDGDVVALQAEAERIRQALRALEAKAGRATAEAQALLGKDRGYAAARSRQHTAEAAAEVARDAVRVAEEDVVGARAAARDARLVASSFQREHELPDRAGRQTLAEGLAELRTQLRELGGPAERLTRDRRQHEAVAAKLGGKEQGLVAAEAELELADEERERRAGELEMVKQLEGPELLSVQDELDRTEPALAEVKAALKALADQGAELTKRAAVLDAQVEVVGGRVKAAVAGRDAARAALAVLGAHGLLELPGEPLDAARALVARGAPTDSLTQLSTRVSAQITALREALSPSRGYVVAQEYPGDDRDLIVVTVARSGEHQRVRDLAEQLATELESLKASISEQEQQLMRKWIVDGLADALAVRLAEVREQVERTNRVLARCRTHFGIRVGLQWEIEAEAADALRDTVALLKRGPGMLDADAQAQLGDQLQALIDAERDRGEGTTAEQIARALDYRAWHRFWVQVTRDGGPTRKLTNRLLVAGSGGERAIMLQLPLFAALAGFFDGAALPSPRALVLDEAFEGIDDAHARQMLEVLGELDLDFMMASYKLRPFVPTHRFALINLRRFRSQRVVVGQRSVWTGSQLVADE
ncbi:uncharacterized protein (TIGR02680 family) [Solirubrobacter pauli]|uniref:Uncharacterized protein (TIGR02680 family) n=1 Tax=Solirubrobacter pauli TaxID=166793 RepID=A0A660LB51_9ACTN|nr:TIGR02680 family protein [Solirubrobacter pauli]RKQ91636.1 uncharacterized protein (TIGR02680 family) [Solirubrobacter pauli]